MRKVNKLIQERIQSDLQQVLNIKGKDRQIQLPVNSQKKKKKKKSTICKRNTAEYLTKSTTMKVPPWNGQ